MRMRLAMRVSVFVGCAGFVRHVWAVCALHLHPPTTIRTLTMITVTTYTRADIHRYTPTPTYTPVSYTHLTLPTIA